MSQSEQRELDYALMLKRNRQFFTLGCYCICLFSSSVIHQFSPPPQSSNTSLSFSSSSSSNRSITYYTRSGLKELRDQTTTPALVYTQHYQHPQWPPSAIPRPASWPLLARPPFPLSFAVLMQLSTPFPILVKRCLPLNGLFPQSTPPLSMSPLNPPKREQRPSTSTAGRLTGLPRSLKCNLIRWT